MLLPKCKLIRSWYNEFSSYSLTYWTWPRLRGYPSGKYNISHCQTLGKTKIIDSKKVPAGIGDAFFSDKGTFLPPTSQGWTVWQNGDKNAEVDGENYPRFHLLNEHLGDPTWNSKPSTLPTEPLTKSPQNKNYNNINFTFSWNHWNHQNKDVVR